MPALMSFLKKMDATVGRLAAKYLPLPLKLNLLTPERILVIRPGGMGDAILLAATIRTIRNSFPDAFITVLAERRNAAVFSMISEVNQVLNYDCARELIQILLNKYDVVIDTEQWYRLSAVVARLIRAPVKIGFGTNERRRMFTHGVQYDLDANEPYNFATLLQPLGIDCRGNVGIVTQVLPLQAVSKAGKLLQPFSLESFVVIFSGASIPEKRWGADRFSHVAQKLTKSGYRIVVVGGKEDRADGDIIAEAEGLNLAGMTSLSETAAVIARSRLVISGDSGVLHIAVGLGIPTVSLFGPSSVKKWAPKGEKHIVLNHQLSCSPCSQYGTIPPCPHGIRCMNEITADQVVEAAVRLLQKY